MDRAAELIKTLALEPHPEGGYYRRLYTSGTLIETPRGTRPTLTSIHYLLHQGDYSAFHRLASDELWYWQGGGALRLYRLTPNGDCRTHVLSPNEPFLAIPAGDWFAAEPLPETDFVLVSCAVSPGFDFADFELADPRELREVFPSHGELIERLCRC